MSTSLKGRTRVVRLSDLMKLRRFMGVCCPWIFQVYAGLGTQGATELRVPRLGQGVWACGRMVRPAGLVIPASRSMWMVGRRDVLIPVHQPADPRSGFCPARTALSTPSWPGTQAVRRSLDLFDS